MCSHTSLVDHFVWSVSLQRPLWFCMFWGNTKMLFTGSRSHQILSKRLRSWAEEKRYWGRVGWGFGLAAPILTRGLQHWQWVCDGSCAAGKLHCLPEQLIREWLHKCQTNAWGSCQTNRCPNNISPRTGFTCSNCQETLSHRRFMGEDQCAKLYIVLGLRNHMINCESVDVFVCMLTPSFHREILHDSPADSGFNLLSRLCSNWTLASTCCFLNFALYCRQTFFTGLLLNIWTTSYQVN